MSQPTNSDTTFRTERLLSATPRQVFAAFENPDRLARWWGPKGFTNTFQHFDFKPGGRWVFIMHGPNGADYPNENIFSRITPDTTIVIRHDSPPHYTLTLTLTPRGEKTHLAWAQAFDTAEVAAKLRPICIPANEQNLDRLEWVLKEETGQANPPT